MRRGHPGIGNWRGENPRHFRPRGGGTLHFRPSMPYGPIESNRFQSPGPRYRGLRPYNQMHLDDSGPSDHDRQYRGPPNPNNQPRLPFDNRERQILPILMKQKNNHGGSFNKATFFEGNQYNTNNMGDVDHRARDVDHRSRDVDHRQQNFGPGPIASWINPPFERRNYHIDKSLHKTPKHHNTGDALLPLMDYSGHRPPSSDHYSDISGPNNNNNPYSRSVDDTVDIVRKRLMNRDSQDHSDPTTDHEELDTDMRKNIDETLHEPPQEQPVKKRIQRQKSNCHKMKNKIVHQLFKMDKGKIHKLMDNPNSSSKFEYAISSLITESQNSFNRHMRSVAEKSLTTASSSSDFIHDDNNTIYEDTFMRQMQGILDPQDTILLEDIKPLILAELSKVLSLDDFERCEGTDEHGRYTREEYNYPHNDFPNNTFCEQENHTEIITSDIYDDSNKYDFNQPPPCGEPSPLFERRPPKREFSDERSRSRSTERWQPRKSIDNISQNRSNEAIKEIEEPRPLFDGNCDQLSEDDDPFAELDNQYHVAVDHNFIECEDPDYGSPIADQMANLSPKTPPSSTKYVKVNTPVLKASANDIIKEIDTQLQSIGKSPLKLLVDQSKEGENAKSKTLKVKQEIQDNVLAIKQSLDQNVSEKVKVKQEPTPQKPAVQENMSAIKQSLDQNVLENVKVKQESTPQKPAESEPMKSADNHANHVSRKRSVDTKPSHRKEKRKKSSHSECHEAQAATSIFNMFYEKPAEKDNKTIDSKSYSDKYFKRKEPPKKPKEKAPVTPKPDTSKPQNNSKTSHSNTSPKDTSASSVGDQTPSKVDKVKLTAIDIFSGEAKPKKGNAHQSHRNTSASTPLSVVKNPDENKIKPVTSFARKVTRRHMGTQVIRKVRNKECQTLKYRSNTEGTQTDPVKFEKNLRLSADPLERMKEIDMEIQMLLQEKFKLYNSMETKNKDSIGSSSTMGTLGMAVLNVPIETDENEKESEDLLADSIAEEFTNLPVEELEQIAMETIEVCKSSSPVVEKRGRRQKLTALSRKNSESPTSRKKKNRTPNISLLEQIISDDRPIEEIISLEDLEGTPVRSKRKPTSKSSKRKPTRKQTKPFVSDPPIYNLKECSVVLNRLEISNYEKSRADELKIKINLKTINIENLETEITSNAETVKPLSPILEKPAEYDEEPVPQPIEEPVNDIQIDMTEVCEDIVIGDELKPISDVEERIPVNEEIILDNSQSSADYPAPEITEGECKMYDYSTDDILKRDSVTVTGNADAVLAIECVNNSFIAACLDGNVYHFTTDGQLLNTLRGSNLAVTCLTIVKENYGTTVYTGSLDSRIRYYDLDTGLEKGPECNVLSPIQTMDRAWDTVFVGTRTGFVLQFECKNNMLIPVSTVKFSEQSILALRAMKEGPRKVLLVAARSDNVTIKDAQTGLLLRTLEGPKMTVYSLLFEDGKVYCGTSSHQIHVFDYASGSHVVAHSGGKGAVCLRAVGGLVFAGCYDGCVYVFRESEPRPLAQLRGPHLMLLSLAIHSTKIIAGYKDRSLYIWKIPLGVLQEMIL